MVVMSFALSLFGGNLAAQDRELEAAKRQVQELLEKAEWLHAEGRAEQAQDYLAKARELKARLERAHQRSRQAQPGDDLREILQGLEQGMRALRALECHEELKMVERVAADAKRKLEHVAAETRGHDRQPEREAANDRERQMARETIHALRLAKEAIQAAGRADSAELVHKAIRAREVNLEGRRDREAQELREQSPNHAAQTELLSWGAKLLREQAKPDAAERVGKVAEQFLARYRKQQAEERGERERPEAAMERRVVFEHLEELSGRIRELGSALEQVQRQMHELRRHIDR
jgi:hypothetical protein